MNTIFKQFLEKVENMPQVELQQKWNSACAQSHSDVLVPLCAGPIFSLNPCGNCEICRYVAAMQERCAVIEQKYRRNPQNKTAPLETEVLKSESPIDDCNR